MQNSIQLVTFAACIYVISGRTHHLYVSPSGSDQNDGSTTQKPLKTITQAIVKSQDSSYNNSVVYIELMPGYHDLEGTVVIRRPNLVIRSYSRQEVHVTGGRRIPFSIVHPVTDKAILSRLPANARPHVRVVDLHDMNITEYGKMESYGTNHHRNSPLELFYNGQPLHYTRWPNDGFLDIVSFPDGVKGKRFHYNSTVPRSWHDENDPWVYGYWYAGWTDEAVKVKSLDTTNEIVTLERLPVIGFRLTGHWKDFETNDAAGEGGHFRFINILAELDQPGEYYLDRVSGKLYMWVPNHDGNIRASDVLYISMINNCFEIYPPADQVHLEDFTLEACRRHGIFSNNIKGLKLYKLEIRNTGNIAVNMAGDTRNSQVTQCYVHDTCGGVWMNGGNRTSLESSGNVVQHNELTRYDRLGAVGIDGIHVSGDGFVIKNNHIHDGQGKAIVFLGNDINMRNNLIHHVCKNMSNCPAFNTYHDLTYRGNIIQTNIVHDVSKYIPGGPNRAVYLDNLISGVKVVNNVFYNNDIHVSIGGGQYNEIKNNVLYNAKYGSISVDFRGMNKNLSSMLDDRLHAVPYNSTLWSLRYPDLANLDTVHNGTLPIGNQVTKNIIYAAPNTYYLRGVPGQLQANTSAFFNFSQTGFSSGSNDHVDVSNRDLRVTCKARVWASIIGFHQVMTPNTVGPSSSVGPTYLKRGRVHLVNATSPANCTSKPPPTEQPVPAYIPDGSSGNEVFHRVDKTGCWLNVTKCANHPTTIGAYRDMYGERYRNASVNESMCFKRANEHWQLCGANINDPVLATYGPTGNSTLGGDGCYVSWYGCPKHGGPEDGHRNTSNGRWFRDGAKDQPGCLRRSLDIWRWCGSSSNYPVTSIYLPTGAKRTAGGGCWISMESCPKDRRIQHMFYDVTGATYYQTDDDEFSCLHRAQYFWSHCGSHANYPVTATYRPTTNSLTFP